MRKHVLAVAMAVAALAVMVTPALAFHDGGVAACRGCHTMHNSENGVMIDPDAPNGNPYLLKDATASDMCLSCHGSSRGAVFGTDPLAPPPQKGGGNFVFLLEDNLNDGHNGQLPANWVPGRAGAHNIVAPSRGVVADPVLTVSPGGSYPASAMGCSSCHDPHGNGNFRLLYGQGHVHAGNFNFVNAAPEAHGIGISGTPNPVESPTSHTAYNSGMSAWCANCHGNFHAQGTRMVHKSGVAMGQSIADIYGLYDGTEALHNNLPGDPATSYIPEVPFEDVAMTTDGTGAPTATSQVSCISCHRAHGSSSPNLGRWDFNVSMLANDGVNSGSYAIPQPYGSHQRSLCNKCHAKDAGDVLDPGGH